MPEPLHSRCDVNVLAVEPTAATSRFIPFPREDVEQSIPARFERQVLLYPDRIAVADAESTLTYRELNRLANRIAHAVLAMRGAGSRAGGAAGRKWCPRLSPPCWEC